MERIPRTLLISTRVLFGILFLNSGVNKLLTGFTAESYLQSTYGPFTTLFQSMAGNGIVDFLVIGGEISIGIALILGVFLWFTAYAGSLMMMLFYFSQFPPKTGIINMHIIYILVFFLLASLKSGYFSGFQPFIDTVFKSRFKNSK